MLLNSLNEQQRKAAEIIDGPVMVFAGAGSGKTRTLTYRIGNMINHGIDPSTILAITFTNKATNEMKERLFNLVGTEASLLTITTFHSLCASILRKEIKVLGYKNSFEIIDDEDQLKIISEVLENGNYDKKQFPSKHIKKKLNYSKCFELKSDIPTENEIFARYEILMKESNLLDFEDLLIKTREIFKNFPNILERYQNKYKYILVDEFQDTDIYQYDIIKLMAQVHRNIFVVGDDDQSIYGFRGSNYENIKRFKKDFKEYSMVILDQNYRSTQTILEGSNNLISNNLDREPKKMYSNILGSPDDVVVHQAKDQTDEVNYVIDNIRLLLKNGYQHSNIAIIYRSSAVLRNFELGMIQSDIKYRVFGGLSYLRRKEIKDMIAYLRLIVFNDDIQSFKRVVNEPGRGIGSKTVQTVADYRSVNKIDLFKAIDDTPTYIKSKARALIDFKELIMSLSLKIDELDLVSLYEEILENTGYIESLEDDESKEERIENLMEFKSILYSIENNGEIATRTEKLIAAFDEAILADDKLQSQRQASDGITLSTVHSVKGLEFDIVFLVALENGIFPNFYRFDKTSDLEEERRIAYVAVTRAKKKLFLTCAQARLIYGAYNRNPQSQFLLEFIKNSKIEKPEEKPEEIKFVKLNPEEPKETKDNNYKIGEMVNHSTYGDGIVVSLTGNIGKICFTKQGVIKSFDMTHPTISKK